MLLNNRSKLFTDSIITMTGGIVVGLINYAFNIIAGRLLGPEKFSVFGSAMALFYVGSVASSTIGLYMVKRYRHREQYSLHSYFVKFVKTGVTASLLLVVFSPLIGHAYNLPAVYIVLLAGFLLLSISGSVFASILQAQKRFLYQSVLGLINTMLKLILGIGFLLIVREAYMLFGGILISGLIGFCLYAYLLRREKILTGAKTPTPIDRTFGYMLAIIILQNLIFGGDVLAAQKYLQPLYGGYVAAMATFGKVIFWISASFSTVLFAHVVNPIEAKSDPASKLKKSLLVSTILCASGAVIILLGRNILVPALFGSAYTGAADLVMYMSLPLALYSAYHVLVQYSLTQPTWRSVSSILGLYLIQNFAFAFWATSAENIYLIQAGVYLVGILNFAQHAARKQTTTPPSF